MPRLAMLFLCAPCTTAFTLRRAAEPVSHDGESCSTEVTSVGAFGYDWKLGRECTSGLDEEDSLDEEEMGRRLASSCDAGAGCDGGGWWQW